MLVALYHDWCLSPTLECIPCASQKQKAKVPLVTAVRSAFSTVGGIVMRAPTLDVSIELVEVMVTLLRVATSLPPPRAPAVAMTPEGNRPAVDAVTRVTACTHCVSTPCAVCSCLCACVALGSSTAQPPGSVRVVLTCSRCCRFTQRKRV